MLDVRNRRLAALPALALGLLLFAPSASSAGHGLGRMTVTPTRVLAGSAGNTLAFAYVADTRAFRGEMLVDVARGWSTPQTTSAMAPGYVRVAHGTCSNRTRLLRLVSRRLVIAVSCASGQRFSLTYSNATAPTLSADGYVFVTQTKPAKAPKAKKRHKKRKLGFQPLAPEKQPVVVVVGNVVNHLVVSATSVATVSTGFGLNIRAVDAYGNNASGYTGQVSFTSTDPRATLPSPYRFVTTDGGGKTFPGTVLRTPGVQRIVARDDAGRVAVSNPITVYPTGG